MGPRQLLRLFESRKSEVYDDQKTPTQISQAETLADTHQDFLEFVLSQLRQIIGTDNWHDEVPATLTELFDRNTFLADCLATDSVGDCVQARIPDGGIYHVTKCDPQVEVSMPAAGIIISKSDSLHCRVQHGGIIEGLYGGLEIKRPLFVDVGGGLTQDLPILSPGNWLFAQSMGMVIDDDVFILNPNSLMSRYRG